MEDNKELKTVKEYKALLEDTELTVTKKVREIAGLKTNLNSKDTEITELKKELSLRKRYIEELQQAKLVAEKENEKIRTAVKTSYTAHELSEYLNKTIAAFNEEASSDNAYARYIINGMDVDLKAQLYTDTKSGDAEGGILRFTAADAAVNGAEALSSIRISIRAVPKE